MATQDRTVAFLQEQLGSIDGLSIRKMFGEYGVWVDGKTIGLICNDQLFLKPTEAAKALAPAATQAPPYEGAKPNMVIDADQWEDREWLVELVQATAAALPAPKPKRLKKQ